MKNFFRQSVFPAISLLIVSISCVLMPEGGEQEFSRWDITEFVGQFFTEPPQTQALPVAAEEDQQAEIIPTRTPAATAVPARTAAVMPTVLVQPDAPTGRIIYTCQVDKNPSHDQICMINADGSGFAQMTDDLTSAHFYPSWAPDGNGFYYAGVQDYQFKIFFSDMNGNEQLLGKIPGELYAPMASPDGNTVIFTRHVSDIGQYISLFDRETEKFQDLAAYFDAKDPVWSPDGSKILFSSMEDNTTQLYFMNADGTFIQKITELSGLRGRTDWAADLAIATYAGEFEEHNREIILFTLGGEVQVITDGGDNLAPAFSPDGQWIVFMSYRDNFWQADGCELYIMRRDGSDVRRLTENDYCDYQPRWGK